MKDSNDNVLRFIRRNGRIIPIRKKVSSAINSGLSKLDKIPKSKGAKVAAAIGVSVVVGNAVMKVRQSLMEKIRGKGKTGTGNPIGTMVLDATVSGIALTGLARKSKSIGEGFSILSKLSKIRK